MQILQIVVSLNNFSCSWLTLTAPKAWRWTYLLGLNTTYNITNFKSHICSKHVFIFGLPTLSLDTSSFSYKCSSILRYIHTERDNSDAGQHEYIPPGRLSQTPLKSPLHLCFYPFSEEKKWNNINNYKIQANICWLLWKCVHPELMLQNVTVEWLRRCNVDRKGLQNCIKLVLNLQQNVYKHTELNWGSYCWVLRDFKNSAHKSHVLLLLTAWLLTYLYHCHLLGIDLKEGIHVLLWHISS